MRGAFATWLQNTFIDQPNNPFDSYMTGPTEVRQSKGAVLIQHSAAQSIILTGHLYPQSGARIERQLLFHLPIKRLGLLGISRR